MNCNVALLDSHTMFTRMMAHYLNTSTDLQVVSECKEAAELFDALRVSKVDILLLEFNVCDRDGVEVISDVRNLYPDIKIIVMSNYKDCKFVRKAMLKGADAYLFKGNEVDELEYAIESVLEGKTYLGKGVRTSPSAFLKKESLSSGSHSNDSFILKQKLTKREKEILSNIAKGKNNKEIGKDLFISFQTVGVHKKNIMKKLGVRNTMGLIKVVLEKQLV